jgi:hypothetical protein
MLAQASEIVIDVNDEELVEYLNTLHEAIFESYSGMLHVRNFFKFDIFCILILLKSRIRRD